MGKPDANEKILSYNDVVLRRSDLDILRGRYFLNDRIIEFYFSFLSSSYPSPDILLVPPSIAFWIMNSPDAESLKDFLEPLKLADKKLIIFPVNDNDDVTEAGGGRHWSLLVFERNSEVFVHHDSCGGMNGRHARQLYKAIAGFVDCSSSDGCEYFEHPDSPQQQNGYDCGLYVTATARTICSWYENDSRESNDARGLWFSELKENVTPCVVAEMRSEIRELIKSLMPKQ